MKKMICMLLILCLSPVIALGDIDLSFMTYDSLVDFNRIIVAEIMSRPEWEEVEIPSGIWKIGEDIPAGIYSIRPVGVSVNCSCYDENGRMQVNLLCLEGKPIGKIELKEGWVCKLTKPVIFAPPVPLGF